MQNVVLEVKNLTKKFGSPTGEFTAVDNLSFSIKEGEILGLLGPNGAGKTTTIHMLLGVTQPSSGEIKYFGKSFKNHREEILKEVNFASTYISLPFWFTLVEILEVFAKLYEVKDWRKRSAKLMQVFGLEHLAKTNFYKLSAGEKTRAILAKAFVNFPKVILLDEPTASLDVEIATKVREFLKKERQEYDVSMLLASHNMSEVEELCDRILIINHGKIIKEGKPEELKKEITDCEVELLIVNDYKQALMFFKDKEFPFEHEKFRFKIPLDEKRIAEFLMLLTDERIEYEEISINKPGLEDYFLKVLEEQPNE